MFYPKIKGHDIFTLGATVVDRDFIQQYMKLVADIESDIDGHSSDDSSSDSNESDSDLSNVEGQGISFFLTIETCSPTTSSHFWST